MYIYRMTNDTQEYFISSSMSLGKKHHIW